jgi:hypothetical protein
MSGMGGRGGGEDIFRRPNRRCKVPCGRSLPRWISSPPHLAIDVVFDLQDPAVMVERTGDAKHDDDGTMAARERTGSASPWLDCGVHHRAYASDPVCTRWIREPSNTFGSRCEKVVHVVV